MLQKLLAAAAWACFVFIVYATLSSPAARPGLTSSEPFHIVLVERIGAYALLGSLFCLAYPGHIGRVCITVLGGAVCLELLQLLVPGRDARVLDALEKIAGGALGISFTKAIVNLVARRGLNI